jgi:hypothetical protein
LLYDGRVNFQKELFHGAETVYAANMPCENSRLDWDNRSNTDCGMPRSIWIGYKFLVSNIENNTKVKLSLLLDLTEGKDGGNWGNIIEYVDDGRWQERTDFCAHPNSQILLEPGTSVFLRNDSISSAKYMKFSIREIATDS